MFRPEIQSAFMALTLLTMIAIGCARSEVEAEPASAKVNSPAGHLQLDEDTRQRLGISVVPVETASVRTSINAIGWFEAPPGSEITIKSPIAGFVDSTEPEKWPKQGEALSIQQAVATLKVFLSPQDLSQMVQAKEENDIVMQQSLVTMALSEAQLQRAEDAGNAVTGIRLDQLKESLERAKAAYKESKEKLPFLLKEPYENGGLMSPISLMAPISGRILASHAAPGQHVQLGDPLWEIGDWSTLWLRVPLFQSDVSKVITEQPATLRDAASDNVIFANYVSVPTRTDAATHTISLFFAVPNAEWKFRVGQSHAVGLPTSGEQSVLMIPKSCILYDGFGQPSCYAAESHSVEFSRKHLELGATHADRVIVTRGLDADDIVVSTGAEQMAAEESKSELVIDDDD